ncbi:MAG: replicative DNA helicase [Paludibacter sp.]|jgi:replicative DNA helicase|nr:replicative DNA helicase [Paludibacter sp.]
MAERKNYTRQNGAATVAPIPENEVGKLPPQALELEDDVLGALMLETDAYSKISETLNYRCFYKVTHQLIYIAITELAAKQEPIDMHTVTEQLRKNDKLEEAGGAYYITLLTAKVSSAAHLEYHSHIILQKYLARELIRVSTNITQKAYDDKADVDDLMQEAESEIFKVSQQNLKKEVMQINPLIEEARRMMLLASQNEGRTSGVPTGFHSIDKVTAGWQKTDLIIVAARPAMGKTAFVLSMAKNMAVDYNRPVALFSLEMSNIQLVNRLIMNVCEIEGEKIKKGELNTFEWEKFDKRVNQLMGAPIYVDDTPSLSVSELRSKARRLVKERKIECIIIDYLQLMNGSGLNFYSREQEVSMISRSLKALAKELDLPIIALSQLNRGVEGRTGIEGKRPQLSDLRESGAIEQDADIVCFIHRPEYYGLTEDKNTNESLVGIAEFIIAKHRNGATGIEKLRFKNVYAKFTNLDDVSNDSENGYKYKQFPSKMNNAANESFYPDVPLPQQNQDFSSPLPPPNKENDGVPF